MPVPILLQAGARKPRPLYNAPGRAFRDLPSLARPKLCPLEALRWGVGGETMTTPGGAGTPYKSCHVSPRARRTGFSHRVGALWSTLLRPFALPRSYAAGCFLCTG
jgi:hypothetical protein